MNPKTKKRLLVVGGVVTLGAVAYWLYTKSQESAAPQMGPTPAPGPLPQPKPAPVLQTKQPSSSLQDSIALYKSWQASLADLSTVARWGREAEMAALKQKILAQAKLEGVTVNV